jgi:hypothetical protein
MLGDCGVVNMPKLLLLLSMFVAGQTWRLPVDHILVVAVLKDKVMLDSLLTQLLPSPVVAIWLFVISGWSPGQLEQEIASGAWWVVAAGQGLVLPSSSSSSDSSSNANKQQQMLAGRAPDALWRHMLQLIGRPVQADRANYH